MEYSQVHQRLFRPLKFPQGMAYQYEYSHDHDRNGGCPGPAKGLCNRSRIEHRSKPNNGSEKAQWIEKIPFPGSIIDQEACSQGNGKDPDRHVDEENGPPNVKPYQPAS